LSELKREELSVGQRRAILVGVYDHAEKKLVDDPVDELRGLVESAGVEIVGTLIQYKRYIDGATVLGSGKVEELRQMVETFDAELVVFDNNLSPSQGRNLEKALDVVIVDRSEVILDIFASRARTHEAKLQVELAQLLYQRPRLKRMWTHLERIEGGVGTARGPGEKQIETDRRLIDQRIDELKKKLAEVERHRERMVAQRSNQKTVSLVGYTNAGKSTLMNVLTGADVYAADQLFATLDTRTRRWSVPQLGDVLLSDTVGFVRRLPHHLVASFKSTLEEARHADLLLHVVDASHPDAELQIETVHQVLDEIGVDRTNMLLVLNKCDAVSDRSLVDVLRVKHEAAVAISAVSGEGLDRLAKQVAERLGNGFVRLKLTSDVSDGRLHFFLNRHTELQSTEYEGSTVTYVCRTAREHLGTIRSLAKEVVELDENGQPAPAASLW